ncbi:glycoside hydrolase family 117 protein [Agaribacterium sp. ZY112]|uniref:glycoside hydrolase family 117 protein n=1 Tax=Agaribacterium sp. ZY112 TaxID=3233574 RepID=UPI003524777B
MPTKTEFKSFPWDIPQSKPDRPLSEAMERMYDNYLSPRPEDNDLFTSFKYTKLEGLDYGGHDGCISRRDPSKIIKANGRYYVWYTKRHTELPPRGAQHCSDTVPSTDWDLADIFYATSEDGFTWQEQGVAINRPDKPTLGWRSVATPDILCWQGRYYLYYQTFNEPSMLKGDNCPVAMASADSPDGPWTRIDKEIIENGEPGSWDQYSIHGPSLLVRDGKIFLYYKAAFGDRPEYLCVNGLAIADNPLGPFEKHPLNPILNSGHETTYFPFKEGIAAFAIRNGNETNTIQWSADGVNFKIASVTQMMPVGAKAYNPEAFIDTKNGKGIRWGLCHFADKKDPTTKHSYLGRFDCNLVQGGSNTDMKETDVIHAPEVFFAQSLSEEQQSQCRQRAIDELSEVSSE